MWKLSCSQSQEQGEQIAALQAELARLKASKSGEAAGSPSVSEPSVSTRPSGRSSPIARDGDRTGRAHPEEG